MTLYKSLYIQIDQTVNVHLKNIIQWQIIRNKKTENDISYIVCQRRIIQQDNVEHLPTVEYMNKSQQIVKYSIISDLTTDLIKIIRNENHKYSKVEIYINEHNQKHYEIIYKQKKSINKCAEITKYIENYFQSIVNVNRKKKGLVMIY